MKPPSYGPMPPPPNYGNRFVAKNESISDEDSPTKLSEPVSSYNPQPGPPYHGQGNVPPEGWGRVTVRVEPDMSEVKMVADYALQSYNKNHRSNYEFVEGKCNPFLEGAIWYHINFKAKDKSVSDEDSPTKIFFAELKATRPGFDVTACRILDGRKQVAGCLQCDNDFLHPTSGFQRGRFIRNWDRIYSLRKRPRDD